MITRHLDFCRYNQPFFYFGIPSAESGFPAANDFLKKVSLKSLQEYVRGKQGSEFGFRRDSSLLKISDPKAA